MVKPEMLRKYIEQTIPKQFKVYDSVEVPTERRATSVYINEMHRVNKHQMKKGSLLNNRFYSQLSPYYDLENHQDETLIFESRFESGNLHQAYRVG